MNFQKILQTREIINIHTAESITRIKTFCHTVNAKFSSCGEHDSDIEASVWNGKNSRARTWKSHLRSIWISLMYSIRLSTITTETIPVRCNA